MIDDGSIEAGVDDVIAVDPVMLERVDFVDPVMVECGIADSGMADLGVVDPGLAEVVPLDGSFTDDSVTDDSDMVFTTGEWSGEGETSDGFGAEVEPGRPVDPMPEWRTLDGGEATDEVLLDDGSMGETDGGTKDGASDDSGEYAEFVGITMVADTDGSIDDTDVIDDSGSVDLGAEGEPGRPVDPMPEWRTLDGDTATDDVATTDGSITDKDGSIDDTGAIDDTGSIDGDLGTDDSFNWTFEDFIKITGEDGTPPLYTMDPDDDLIFQTMGPIDETPGRGSDPLPFERTNADPVLVATVEIDRTPVNYAAADTFHSGLDLV